MVPAARSDCTQAPRLRGTPPCQFPSLRGVWRGKAPGWLRSPPAVCCTPRADAPPCAARAPLPPSSPPPRSERASLAPIAPQPARAPPLPRTTVVPLAVPPAARPRGRSAARAVTSPSRAEPSSRSAASASRGSSPSAAVGYMRTQPARHVRRCARCRAVARRPPRRPTRVQSPPRALRSPPARQLALTLRRSRRRPCR